MSIKTTGKEFKVFYNDPVFWPEGRFHDDGLIIIDGNDDMHPMDAIDESKIVIEGGIIYDNDYNDEVGFMETHFKKWREAQTVEYVTVEIPKGSSELLKEFIKTLK